MSYAHPRKRASSPIAVYAAASTCPLALSPLVGIRPGALPVIMTKLSRCRACYSRLNSQSCAAFSHMIVEMHPIVIHLLWPDNAVQHPIIARHARRELYL